MVARAFCPCCRVWPTLSATMTSGKRWLAIPAFTVDRCADNPDTLRDDPHPLMEVRIRCRRSSYMARPSLGQTAPKGQRRVATGEATQRRSRRKRNPWTRNVIPFLAPEGRRRCENREPPSPRWKAGRVNCKESTIQGLRSPATAPGSPPRWHSHTTFSGSAIPVIILQWVEYTRPRQWEVVSCGLLSDHGDLSMIYRRRVDVDVWHFCPTCSMWPNTRYIESHIPPGSIFWCNQCTASLTYRRAVCGWD